jgi:proteic killer suppression protein
MPSRYRDKRTERLARRQHVPAFSAFAKQALRRLDRLNAARTQKDLITPPSNRFEALKGDRQGQYSIRINDQWRICFEWPDGAPHPYNIEIVDYH